MAAAKQKGKPPTATRQRSARKEKLRIQREQNTVAAKQEVASFASDLKSLSFVGRQTTDVPYTEELNDALLDLVGTGHSLEAISHMPGMPRLIVLLKWVYDASHPFCKTYAQGKQLLVALYEEKALQIAQQALHQEIRTERSGGKDGGSTEVKIVDNVQRAALIVDTMKWTLSHLMPKKHGKQPDPPQEGDALKDLLGQFRKRNEALGDD